MVTSDERMRILKMVEDGKISAEEGARLLVALRESGKDASGKDAGRGPGSPSSRVNQKGWLRVRVTDVATGRTKVNVNLPLRLVDAGMNIATQFAPNINFSQIADAVRSGELEGKIVDVLDEEDGEHIEVYVD
jgi:hypothetical protein